MTNYRVIHHSAGGTKETVQTVRDIHLPKYGRTYYNYIIDRQGTIHHEHDEWNWRGVGKRSKDICVLGDFTKERPTNKQLEQLQVVLKITEVYNFKDTFAHNVAHLHMEATQSACPGQLLSYYDQWLMNQNILDRNVQIILLGSGEFVIPWDDVVSYYRGTLDLKLITTNHIVSPDPEFLPQPTAQIKPSWIEENLQPFFEESADYVIIITKKWHTLNGNLVNNAVADHTLYAGKRTGHIRYTEGISKGWSSPPVDRDLLFDSIIHEISHLVNMSYGRFGSVDKTHEYSPDYLRAVREALETNQDDMVDEKFIKAAVWAVYHRDPSDDSEGVAYWVRMAVENNLTPVDILNRWRKGDEWKRYDEVMKAVKKVENWARNN